MARPVTWWRLWRGKVWHVGWAGDAAACGTEPGAWAERVGERAPVNARACGDCAASVRHLYGLVLAAEAGDPRKPFDPWAAGEALIATEGGVRAEDGVIDVPIVCGACGQPEHEGTCSAVDLAAAPEVSTDEWSCGSCGHPNLDHDCDDGTCSVSSDAFDTIGFESLGPCECRGLTRAG